MPINCYIIIVIICYKDYFIRSNVYILSLLFHYSCLMFVDVNQATADVKESLSQNLTTERDKTTTKYDCLLNSMFPSMILFILLCVVSLILFCFFFKFIFPQFQVYKTVQILNKKVIKKERELIMMKMYCVCVFCFFFGFFFGLLLHTRPIKHNHVKL